MQLNTIYTVGSGSGYVTHYKLSYSLDAVDWNTYGDTVGVEKVFPYSISPRF